MQTWGRQREVEKIKPPAEECLTANPKDTATRLVWYPSDEAIWLNLEPGAQDGLIIGLGATKAAAIDDAIRELEDRLLDLHAAKEARPDA